MSDIDPKLPTESDIKKKARRRGKRRSKNPSGDLRSTDQQELIVDGVADSPLEGRIGDNSMIQPRKPPVFFGKPSSESVNYFKSIEPMLADESLGNMESEELHLLLDNIYDEVDGQELLLITDFGCSRIMEKLIRSSQEFHLRVLMDRLSGKFVSLMCHRFASHVIQTFLWRIPPFLEQELQSGILPGKSEIKEGELMCLNDLFMRMCDEVKQEFLYMATDPYGSHIVRSILVILSGCEIDTRKRNLIKSKLSTKYAEAKGMSPETLMKPIQKQLIPSEYKAKLAGLLDEIFTINMSDEFITEIICNPYSSTVFQVTLLISEVAGANFDRFINAILSERDTADSHQKRDSKIHLISKDQTGSHFMQLFIECCNFDALKIITKTALSGDPLVELSKHQMANYVVQTYLDRLKHVLSDSNISVKSKNKMQKMINKYIDPVYRNPSNIKQLLFRNKPNVYLKYLDLTMLDPEFDPRNDFILPLESAFAIEAPEKLKRELVQHYLRLKPVGDESFLDSRPQPAGAILVSKFFTLEEHMIRPIINSIFAQTPSEIFNWSKHASLSRVLESFITSVTVSAKTKKALIKALQPNLANMAQDKYGSFFVEKCWNVCDISTNSIIVSELVKKKAALESIPHGRGICRMFMLDLYSRRKDEWLARVGKIQSKKNMFEDILMEGKSSKIRKISSLEKR